MNQGDLSRVRRCSCWLSSRRAACSGVRASIVVMKRSNARGAQGRRGAGAQGRRGAGAQEGGGVKIESQETQPPRVPRHFGAKQVGEVDARWAWTEPAVWTDRMLTALEQGVKGGVWFSLIDKVYSTSNLQAAFAKVKANGGAAGCDHQTIAMYESRLEAQAALVEVRRWTDQARLTLHPQKTRIVDAAQEAFDFLGYRFSGGKRWPRDKSLKKLKDAIRLLASTRRQAGRRRVTTAKAWESSSRM